MENHDANPDSLEQLEALRAAGKLSDEEYDTLRDAIERHETPPHGVSTPSQRPRLRKSWRQRQIGGVCGGIARFLDVNPWLIRILALLLALSSCGLALLLYLILYIALPWDEEDAELVWHFPWVYAVGIVVFFVAIIFGLRWMNLQAVAVFENTGSQLPTVTQWVMTMFRYWPLMIVAAVLIALTDGILPKESANRRVFRWVAFCGVLAFLAVCFVAFWLPIKNLG